ncbi:hypothetical protein GGR53DRAFT_529160 [Hypoxylon sp. FL1150]|nr:hypothetical protein GGR53DRAFT_529160 [Hypoxylon sp. FL1150]
MDIKDISTVRQYSAIFEQIKQSVNRASARKGEKPPSYPPPSLLVSRFMMTRAGTLSAKATNYGIVSTSQVPPQYPPCHRPIRELKPLMISSMTLETNHRGSQALVHVLTPPNRMTAVMVIVEDEEGTATLLQLYHQPEESKVTNENIIRAGDVCIIKEPYFKVTTDGSYGIRVDHVSDFVLLQDSDSRIPLKWRKRSLGFHENSSDIRQQGNAAVKKQNWGEAERLYTDAIRTAKASEEEQLAHLNRSLINLHLGRSEKALHDACKGSTSESPPSEKALFREARALYSLGKFSPCLEKLLVLVRSNPKNSDAWAEIKKVKQRIAEEETGSYLFADMYKQAEITPPLIGCATYARPVAVRESSGRGKGLFTTKPVRAGDLLLCEKAFAYSYAGDDSPIGRDNMTLLMNLNTNFMCMGGQAKLITQIVQKLYHNHAESEVFTSLHHGDYVPVAISEADGIPVVDTFLVAEIIRLNCFGAPRTSRKSSTALLAGKEVDGTHAFTTCGVWPMASRINHSCVTNCRRSFIGDMMITFGETQRKFENWGFVCSCALCLDKKRTPKSAILDRKARYQRLERVLKPGASVAQLTQARSMLLDMEKTYPFPRDTPSPPRLELWDPYFAMGHQYMAKSKLADALEMFLKGLEALGFIIVACPPRDVEEGNVGKKEVTLEIKHWGYVTEHTTAELLQMHRAYARLAPELCKIVKEYAGVAYSICMGEKETLGKQHSQFAEIA